MTALLPVKYSECAKKRQPNITDPIFIILHFIISLSLITFLEVHVLDTSCLVTSFSFWRGS